MAAKAPGSRNAKDHNQTAGDDHEECHLERLINRPQIAPRRAYSRGAFLSIVRAGKIKRGRRIGVRLRGGASTSDGVLISAELCRPITTSSRFCAGFGLAGTNVGNAPKLPAG